MTSQEWHGVAWQHDIVLVDPQSRIARGTAILYITGGEPNPLDLAEAHRLANLSGLPVAHLFQIPNQPLFNDLWEDDLIAETLVRCLDTRDYSWPLLMPMATAAVRAMDVLCLATARSKNPLGRFVVTGASKRGWTAWLTAATSDPRVVGIAPMVFDNLNFSAQLAHQVEGYGEPSEMISPYTSRGLGERIRAPEGQRLAAIIDPFSYRADMTLPKMIVNGSNDPYWSVDSLSLYWEELPPPKWASIVPNAGHGLGDMSQALEAIGVLSRSCVGKFVMPRASWSYEREAILVECEPPFPLLRLWIAESGSMDFRASEWWMRSEAGAGKLKAERMTAKFQIPRSTKNQAAMVQMAYSVKGHEFSFSTPIKVWRSQQ